MRRTRKWKFVAQEAARLAEVGLSPAEIAKKLEINRSSVHRWMASGKLADTRRGSNPAPHPEPNYPGKIRSATAWAEAIRRSYALDATDDELVSLAEGALGVALDASLDARVRLIAAGRFQSIVKQLALVARAAEGAQPAPVQPPEKKAPARVLPRPGADPRTFLQAVK